MAGRFLQDLSRGPSDQFWFLPALTPFDSPIAA
jgi:hypothetical protein